MTNSSNLHYYFSDPVFDNFSAFSSTLTHEECLSDLPLNHYAKFLQQKDPNITKDLVYNFFAIVQSGLQPNTYTPHNAFPDSYLKGNRGQDMFALTKEQETIFQPLLNYFSNLPHQPRFDTQTDPTGARSNTPETFNEYWATHPNNFGYTLNSSNDPSRYYDRVRLNNHGSLIEHKDETAVGTPLNNTNALTPNIPTSDTLPYTRYTSIAPYWPYSNRNHGILKNDPYLIKGDMQDPAATYPTNTKRN